MEIDDFFRAPVWYPLLSEHTFTTYFVKLAAEEIVALAEGIQKGPVVKDVLQRLQYPMTATPGNCFIITDKCAPTDTERFLYKHGAVYSPESAWKYLALSAKIRAAAAAGEVEYIGIRPYRRMDRTREFRLFIRDGELVAMSQYNLIRHFERLEGIREQLWQRAKLWFETVKELIPLRRYTADIYFTGDNHTLLLDFNPWGPPTSPLLLNRWERAWEPPPQLVLMPPPRRLSGDVNVSF